MLAMMTIVALKGWIIAWKRHKKQVNKLCERAICPAAVYAALEGIEG